MTEISTLFFYYNFAFFYHTFNIEGFPVTSQTPKRSSAAPGTWFPRILVHLQLTSSNITPLTLTAATSQVSSSISIFSADTSLTIPYLSKVSVMLSSLVYLDPSWRTPDPWMVIFILIFDILGLVDLPSKLR